MQVVYIITTREYLPPAFFSLIAAG